MDNNFYIYTDNSTIVEIERFHICTWEFKNATSIIEFGAEIVNPQIITNDHLHLKLFIPWINSNNKIIDLYSQLKDPENSKFIFNDSVKSSKYVNSEQSKYGVILNFHGRNPLCIMPTTNIINERVIDICIDLKQLKERHSGEKPNLYFRFYIEPKIEFITTRKQGINRTTIIYDMKVNEKRNLPDTINFGEIQLCKISNCFFFNILPNSFDLSFFDTNQLKSVRTLEFESFQKYLGDSRVKKDDLMVVFNKSGKLDNYSFFTRYSKERIGAGQFALAVLVNLLCGILLFLPSLRSKAQINIFSKEMLQNLPIEVYISMSIGILIIIYFIWPKILAVPNIIKSLIRR